MDATAKDLAQDEEIATVKHRAFVLEQRLNLLEPRIEKLEKAQNEMDTKFELFKPFIEFVTNLSSMAKFPKL
jgi:hypothetical protein